MDSQNLSMPQGPDPGWSRLDPLGDPGDFHGDEGTCSIKSRAPCWVEENFLEHGMNMAIFRIKISW